MTDCKIIGTSNSIMRVSYRPFLERSGLFEKVDQLCIGGTPNILLPYALSQVVVSAGEYVILETSVNDIWAVSGRRFDFDMARTIILDTINYLESIGAIPILLMMPTEADQQYIEEMRSFYAGISEMKGVLVVDGYPVLNAISEETGLPYTDLFLDAGHVITQVAGAIAHHLIRAIRKKQKSVSKNDTAQFPEEQRMPFPYFFKKISPLTKKSTERKTKLIETSYGFITPDETVTLSFADPQKLLGVSFNIGASSGVIRITVDEATSHFYALHATDTADGRFFHALSPFADAPTGTKFEISAVAADKVDSETLQVLGHSKFPMVDLQSLEVEGFIFQSDRSHMINEDVPPGKVATRTKLHEVDLAFSQSIMSGREAAKWTAAGRIFSSIFTEGRNLSKDKPADWLRDIGRVMMQVENYDLAIKYFKAALADRPNAIYIKKLLAETMQLRDNPENSAKQEIETKTISRHWADVEKLESQH